MTAPDWLPYATLGVSGVAAIGASCAAFVAGKLNRAEAERNRQFQEAETARNRDWTELQADRVRVEQRATEQRSWERDRVTEHYLSALRAAQELSHTYASAVQPIYSVTPVGDREAAWRTLDDAYGRLIWAVTEARVVARPAVMSVLPSLIDIDISVMVPIAGSIGSPVIAQERAREEVHELAYRIVDLSTAMRVDLGLADGMELQQMAAMRARIKPRGDRSMARLEALADLRSVLARYSVTPLHSADNDYRIGGAEMSSLQLPVPGLRRPVGGLLHIRGTALATAVADDLLPAEEQAVLRGVVRYVESGLRDGPWQRDTPAGDRIAGWSRQGEGI